MMHSSSSEAESPGLSRCTKHVPVFSLHATRTSVSSSAVRIRPYLPCVAKMLSKSVTRSPTSRPQANETNRRGRLATSGLGRETLGHDANPGGAGGPDGGVRAQREERACGCGAGGTERFDAHQC